MSSTAKALSLLSYFSTARPEIGLSQLCRLANQDKATTYRYLQALETVGMVEQNPLTRQYRLGPAVMQLAQIREATVPRQEGARYALRALADKTGETAHATVLSGHTIYRLCECESPHHSIRAAIDMNRFPLHATASGLCALAFGPQDLFEVALQNCEAFTATTTTNKDDLTQLVQDIQKTGIGRANKSYETETYGLSAPVFDHTNQFAGAVAVACVASRLTETLERVIISQLVIASREITRNWGGQIPAHVETAWAGTLNAEKSTEPSS